MPILIILLGMIIPTLITWIYFDVLSEATAFQQKMAYAIGKLVQVGIMIAAYWFWRQRDKRLSVSTLVFGKPICMRWMAFGFVSGVFIACLAIAVFQWLLLPLGVMELATQKAKEKLNVLGSDSPSILLAIAVFYSLIHSGFEEYYWRGFVFRAWKEHLGVVNSVCLSSLGFMSHHILVLGKFFGYGSWVTYFLAISVGVGGAIWASLYHRCGNLIPGWISHALVDAGIFAIGYLLLFA